MAKPLYVELSRKDRQEMEETLNWLRRDAFRGRLLCQFESLLENPRNVSSAFVVMGGKNFKVRGCLRRH